MIGRSCLLSLDLLESLMHTEGRAFWEVVARISLTFCKKIMW